MKINHDSPLSFVFGKTGKVLLMLFLVLSVLQVSAQSVAFSFGGFKYTTQNASTGCCILQTGSVPADGVVVVPDFAYNGTTPYKVVEVAENAFKDISRNIKKLVFGDYVEKIGNKAFEHFAHSVDNCVVIFGKNLKVLDGKAFEHLGEGSTGTKVFMKATTPPTLASRRQSFEHVANTTFYVKDEATYNVYKENNQWDQFDQRSERKGCKYAYPYPVDNEIVPGKWVTTMFPEDMTKLKAEAYFGYGTKIAEFTGISKKIEDLYQLLFTVDQTASDNTVLISANTPCLIKIGNKEKTEYLTDLSYNDNDEKLDQTCTDGEMTIHMTGITNDYMLQKGEIYLRSTDDSKLTFYVAADNNKVGVRKGKCYFKVTDATGAIVEAKLGMMINNEVTGISDLRVDEQPADSRIYNLNGQREGTDASRLSKGIHIVNGKKFVVR